MAANATGFVWQESSAGIAAANPLVTLDLAEAVQRVACTRIARSGFWLRLEP